MPHMQKSLTLQLFLQHFASDFFASRNLDKVVFIISQGALYGIFVCGINCCRVWFGPLPIEICNLQVWVSSIVVWYSFLTLFFISLAKFMYICIWKHMRDMNDDLIVTILVRISILFSIWVSTNGFSNRKVERATSAAMCTGIFNDHNQIMNPEISSDKLPAPYGFILWSLSVTTLFFMVAITTTRKRNNRNMTIIQRPKDLESTLLNFALLILFLINSIGYRIYWRE